MSTTVIAEVIEDVEDIRVALEKFAVKYGRYADENPHAEKIRALVFAVESLDTDLQNILED